jgi:hypothetical protein
VRVLARYLYEDALPRRAEPGLLAAALHVAEYFGVHRLGALCEAALAAEVLAADPEDAGARRGLPTRGCRPGPASAARARAVPEQGRLRETHCFSLCVVLQALP